MFARRFSKTSTSKKSTHTFPVDEPSVLTISVSATPIGVQPGFSKAEQKLAGTSFSEKTKREPKFITNKGPICDSIKQPICDSIKQPICDSIKQPIPALIPATIPQPSPPVFPKAEQKEPQEKKQPRNRFVRIKKGVN